MDMSEAKYEKLIKELKGYGRLAVAFSAGVDSTFLLWAAREALGENVVAITGRLVSFPDSESKEADAFCEKYGIRHINIDLDQMAVPGFKENPTDRCYLCKKALFSSFLDMAKSEGAVILAEGSNADDVNDYRPGLRALTELGIKSPLKNNGLTKGEIRELSKRFGLPTWKKPSLACLATRFPYGETLTEEKIGMVGKAEEYLSSLGFEQVRVRYHGDIARIEIGKDAFERFLDPGITRSVDEKLKEYGFKYVTLDIAGYRTGSMNIGLV